MQVQLARAIATAMSDGNGLHPPLGHGNVPTLQECWYWARGNTAAQPCDCDWSSQLSDSMTVAVDGGNCGDGCVKPYASSMHGKRAG